MELALNLAWALLAIVMVYLWQRCGQAREASRHQQIVAMAVLILILLPAISMTDDLMAAQNPAETDSSIRRDHAYSSPHSIFPAVAGLPMPVFAGVSFGILRMAAPANPPAPFVEHPALASIRNRPPPAA
jgi:lysylphosphatidylglycerol synthetase-like protein (DUF2156 family)